METKIEERCAHCEYLTTMQLIERFPSGKPADWEKLDDDTYCRKCPEHGGKQFDPRSGRTLKAWLEYEVAARCTHCGTRLQVRVFDGQPPKGHDDGIRYQEIVLFGVGKCPKCTVVIAGVLQ